MSSPLLPQQMFNHCWPRRAVIFSSEPLLFQGPFFRAVDVGREAWGVWTPDGSRILQDIGPSLVIVCVEYNDPESELKHSDLIDELVSH